MADETPTMINPVMTDLQKSFNGLQKAPVDAEGKPQPVIIQQLSVRPVNRLKLDVNQWRNDLRSAEALIPRRVQLYDIYADVLLDAHLKSVVDKRIMAVTNVEWTFTNKDGEEVQQLKDWIDTPTFETVVKEVLNSKLWGYTMLEFQFTDEGLGVYVIPRKHMRPEQGMVSVQQTANFGFSIREGAFADTVLEAGEEKDLGLLLVAAQYVIYKRDMLADYAEFGEVFGSPIIDAQWDGYDENQRLLLEQAFEKMGNGGKLIRPAGTAVQFLQGGSNNPTGELFNTFITLCNDEISKLLLGQTETTQSSDTSGYAQASVHADVENDINTSDRNFVRRILNKRLIKILEANGIDTQGGHFSIKDDEKIGLKDRLTMDIQLKTQAMLPISDDYFYEKYGIEKPADYDALKAAEPAVPPSPPPGQMGLSLTDLMKLKELGFFLKAPKAIGAKTISLASFYDHAKCCDVHHAEAPIRLSDDGDDSFIKKVFGGELPAGMIDMQTYLSTATHLAGAIADGIGAKKLDVTDPKTQLYEKMRNNVYAFSGAKSLTMLQEYSNQLKDDKGEVRSYAAFRNAVIPVGQEFNDNYLRTEYNSAVAMAQMAQKWQSLKDYDMIEYRTAGDSRVRPKHKLLDGTVLPPNDPLWSRIYPPNDWGCRCTVVPAPGAQLTNRTMADQFSKSPVLKPYFARNVGTEQIAFPDDHPYFTRAAHDIKHGDSHQFMAVENYGMRPVENIMNDELPTFDAPKSLDEAQTAWSSVKKDVTTADGLKWTMSDRWDHIVTDHKSQDRWKYINQAPHVLSDADEVWSSREKQVNGTYKVFKRYIKYYHDQPMVYSYDINDPDNWTMYKADVDSSGTYKLLRDKVRRGVLIHRK